MTRVVGGRMRGACRGLCGRLVIFLFASCPALSQFSSISLTIVTIFRISQTVEHCPIHQSQAQPCVIDGRNADADAV